MCCGRRRGSQRQSAELTREKVRVGFEAPANGALADASAADARTGSSAQRAECDVRSRRWCCSPAHASRRCARAWPRRRAGCRSPRAFARAAVPAALLAQRPDLAAAERELVAAAADVGVAEAQRLPRLTFSGSIGLGALRIAGATSTARTWALGPALMLPLFDGGAAPRNVDAARGPATTKRAPPTSSARASRCARSRRRWCGCDAADAPRGRRPRAAQGFRAYFAAAEAR